MVWLHGGGYSQGSGAFIIYDGANLACRHDVVVVTVNHRLNVFGYLYLAELGGEKYANSGNLGMLDIVAALEWVRDNIAAFGGDPTQRDDLWPVGRRRKSQHADGDAIGQGAISSGRCGKCLRNQGRSQR